MRIDVVIPVLLVIWFASCKNDLAEINQFIPKEAVQIEEALDVEIYYSDSAIVRVIISGPRLLNYLDKHVPREEFPDGLAVLFFDEAGNQQSKLTSKYGIRYDRDSKVIVRDSVVVTTLKEEKLETEELTWNEKSGKITTDKFVKISNPKEIIFGYGLEATEDFSYWKIKAVTGTMKSDYISDFVQDPSQ